VIVLNLFTSAAVIVAILYYFLRLYKKIPNPNLIKPATL